MTKYLRFLCKFTSFISLISM